MSQLYRWVEITGKGDLSRHVKTLPPGISKAFDDAKRYLAHHQDKNALNFGKRLNGTSRLVFARRVDGAFDGDGEHVFEWLYETSKYAIRLAEK